MPRLTVPIAKWLPPDLRIHRIFAKFHPKLRKNALTGTILHTLRLIAKMQTAYYPKYFETIRKTSDEMLDSSFSYYIRHNVRP